MKKPAKVLSTVALTLALSLTAVNSNAEAYKIETVMWGKTELKLGQIGKITVLKDTQLYKIVDGNTITSTRELKKGEEFRVYSYKNQNGGLYGVGGGMFILKDGSIKYDTPSKTKMAMLKNIHGIFTPVKLDDVSKIFYEVLPEYEQDNLDNAVESYIAGTTGDRNNIQLSYTEMNKMVHYVYVGDMAKFDEGYEIAKRVGLYLTESELKEIMAESKRRGDEVFDKGVFIYYTGKMLQIRW